jgi:hypothetical protein
MALRNNNTKIGVEFTYVLNAYILTCFDTKFCSNHSEALLEDSKRFAMVFLVRSHLVFELTSLFPDEQRDKLIEWWSPLNFFTRQQDIFNTQQPGTGEWFLASDSFKAWVLSVGARLWCPGIRMYARVWLCTLLIRSIQQEPEKLCLRE